MAPNCSRLDSDPKGDGPRMIWTHRKTDLLCFVSDPEEKRRIIGDTFMEVAKRVSKTRLACFKPPFRNHKCVYFRSSTN